MTENTPTPHTSQSPISNETGQGSLEQGLAGNYQLCVGEVVQEAWGRVAGNKSALWIGALIYIAVHFGISLVLGLFVGGDAPSPAPDAAAQMPTTPGRTPPALVVWCRPPRLSALVHCLYPLCMYINIYYLNSITRHSWSPSAGATGPSQVPTQHQFQRGAS